MIEPSVNGKIHAQIISAMSKIEAIEKNRQAGNTGEKFTYNFRGVDEVYNSLHPIMVEAKIFTTSDIVHSETVEKIDKYGGVIFYDRLTIKYRFWADDGSFVETTVRGIGADKGDKASNKAQSVAHKYALLQIFLIPTMDSKDPEEDNSHEPTANQPPPEPKRVEVNIENVKLKIDSVKKQLDALSHKWSPAWQKFFDSIETITDANTLTNSLARMDAIFRQKMEVKK